MDPTTPPLIRPKTPSLATVRELVERLMKNATEQLSILAALHSMLEDELPATSANEPTEAELGMQALTQTSPTLARALQREQL